MSCEIYYPLPPDDLPEEELLPEEEELPLELPELLLPLLDDLALPEDLDELGLELRALELLDGLYAGLTLGVDLLLVALDWELRVVLVDLLVG